MRERARIEFTEQCNLRERVATEYRANWPALPLVGVEQRFGRRAAQHTRQLPAEVHCVLDADVHALASHWRMDVSGITGEENAAVPVVRGEP